VSLWQDVRYAGRTLAQNPGFTTVAVLTLALGMGANTAIFSVVNSILLRPLPFQDSDRLVAIHNQFLALNLKYASCSVADYYDYRDQTQIFEEAAAVGASSYNLTGVDRPERVLGAEVTATLFPLLGLRPLAGRVFSAEEDQPGRNRVVVLDEGLWRRRFGADPGIVGRAIRLNEQSYTVVGVVPAALHFLAQIELWTPIAFTEEQKSPLRRGNQSLFVMGRLRQGVSLEQARAGMKTFAAALAKEYPNSYPPSTGWGIVVPRLSDLVVGDMRPALLVLAAAVGLVLLIAAANVANLLLARAVGRSREVAIRLALGAGSWRILRQLLTESTLLGLLGGVAGLALAYGGVKLLVAAGPQNVPRLSEVAVDGRVLAFTFLVSIITGMLFGLAPALHAGRLHESLKEGGRGGSGGVARHKMRSLLVIAEVTLSLVLLVAAGLLLQSFRRLQRVETGFRPEGVLTFRISLPETRYPEPGQTARAVEQIAERVRALPGVVSVGAVSTLPFSRTNSSGSFTREGQDQTADATMPHADLRVVSPGYFEALGIPLRQGRLLAATDRSGVPGVALVDEKLAKQYWPNQDPLGKRVRRLGAQAPWFTVVGLVGHVQHAQLDAEAKGALYFSSLQNRAPGMTFVARTSNDPRGLAGALPAAVAAVDQDLPVFEIRTMEQRVLESLTPRRFAMYLLGIFAAVALALSAVGIYGVMAQSVTQRTHEIGIRMALGAEPRDVLRLVVGQGMALAAIGLVTGVAAALGLTRWMSRLLFGVRPTDPLTFLAVAAVLAAVALAACYLPARRATRVNPVEALRHE
jgi:putative ABC transport system permease protein